MRLPVNSGGDFTPPPAGTHPAICYRFIDLGTQESNFNGQVKHQHKVMLSWEFPTEKMEDGQPFNISQRYTWSMNEKASLRKDLEAWRGEPFTDADLGPGGFDTKNLLGKACLLTIVHSEKSGKTYGNIRGVVKMPKGMTVPALTNQISYLALDGMIDADFDAVFAKLSPNLQETIKKAPEYHELMRRRAGVPEHHINDAPNSTGADFDDPPF